MLGKKKYAAYTCRSYYVILMHLDEHIFLHNCIMIISQLPQKCKNLHKAKPGLLKWFHNFLPHTEIIDKTALPNPIKFTSSFFNSFEQIHF